MTTTATSPPAAELPALVDVRYVARLLNCSTKHVVRLRDAGHLPGGIKLGTLARFQRAVIEEWIAAGCPQAK